MCIRICSAISLGASLVNDGIALPVIQKVLDHESLEMTAHYARVADG